MEPWQIFIHFALVCGALARPADPEVRVFDVQPNNPNVKVFFTYPTIKPAAKDITSNHDKEDENKTAYLKDQKEEIDSEDEIIIKTEIKPEDELEPNEPDTLLEIQLENTVAPEIETYGGTVDDIVSEADVEISKDLPDGFIFSDGNTSKSLVEGVALPDNDITARPDVEERNEEAGTILIVEEPSSPVTDTLIPIGIEFPSSMLTPIAVERGEDTETLKKDLGIPYVDAEEQITVSDNFSEPTILEMQTEAASDSSDDPDINTTEEMPENETVESRSPLLSEFHKEKAILPETPLQLSVEMPETVFEPIVRAPEMNTIMMPIAEVIPEKQNEISLQNDDKAMANTSVKEDEETTTIEERESTLASDSVVTESAFVTDENSELIPVSNSVDMEPVTAANEIMDTSLTDSVEFDSETETTTEGTYIAMEEEAAPKHMMPDKRQEEKEKTSLRISNKKKVQVAQENKTMVLEHSNPKSDVQVHNEFQDPVHMAGFMSDESKLRKSGVTEETDRVSTLKSSTEDLSNALPLSRSRKGKSAGVDVVADTLALNSSDVA